MSGNHSETLPEISSNSTVSSTIKRVEIEETSNFNIGNIMDDTNKFSNKTSTERSEKLVQSSCSPISTTQIISNESHQTESFSVDDATCSSTMRKSNNNAYNISNADTTTVQGNVLSSFDVFVDKA